MAETKIIDRQPVLDAIQEWRVGDKIWRGGLQWSFCVTDRDSIACMDGCFLPAELRAIADYIDCQTEGEVK